jgi:hypothetical protein
MKFLDGKPILKRDYGKNPDLKRAIPGRFPIGKFQKLPMCNFEC